MSVYGKFLTSIGFNGLISKLRGTDNLKLMINLEFPLQMAGNFNGNFLDPQVVPSSQIALQGDGDIQTVVIVLDGYGNPVDLHQATDLYILLKRPNLTTIRFPSRLTTNGMDGKISCFLSPGFLNLAGTYFIQANFSTNTQPKSTLTGSFITTENIAIAMPVGLWEYVDGNLQPLSQDQIDALFQKENGNIQPI